MDNESATSSISRKKGFPALAHNIAIIPDYEGFVFRKFDRLSARNILHLESKLAYLEWKLDVADEQSLMSLDTETLRCIRTWEAFEENSKSPGRPEKNQMELVEEIRKTLKEYQEALISQNKIAMLQEPKTRALDVARTQSYEYTFYTSGAKVPRRSILGGLAAKKFEEHNLQDLVALRRPADKDLLSRFLQDHWIFKTTTLQNDTEHIVENHVVWIAATISTVIAAVLLLGAVILLRIVQNEKGQIALIVAFTILFAASVGITTNARRAEIFASTAAYTAVLVVFVASSPSGPGSGACKCINTS